MKRVILLLLSVCCIGSSVGANVWPTQPLGGSEKLFYGEERITEIRQKIDTYPWAAELYQRIQREIENPRDRIEQEQPSWLASLRCRDMALYYRISGDQRYIPEIVEGILGAFSIGKAGELFPDKEKKNTALWSWLMMRSGFFHAYDLVKCHPSMVPHTEAVESRLREIVAETHRYIPTMKHTGNTQFWAITMGLGVSSMLLGDVETFKTTLYDDYFGAEAVLNSFKDGGVARAEPLRYYYDYLSCCLTILFEIAKHNDIDDMYHYTSSGGNNFEKILEGFFTVANPDGSLLVNGDSGEFVLVNKGEISYEVMRLFDNQTVMRTSDKWEIYNRAYDNPHFAWLISQNEPRDGYCYAFWGYSALTHGEPLDSIATPEARSVVYPTVGDAHLKSIEGADYWHSEALGVHVRAGKTLINHNNSDHLHIKLNAFGKSIYTDWFYNYDYLAPRVSNNYANKTPVSPRIIAHNTVAVDCGEPTINNIEFSEIDRSNNGAQIFVARGTPYKGVEECRTLCLTREYLLDIFEVDSHEQHTYDFILNSLGTVWANGVGSSVDYGVINDEYGLAPIDAWATRERNVWIADARKAEVTEPTVEIRFRDSDGVGAVATSLCEEPTELITGGLPYYISKFSWDKSSGIASLAERKPIAILRRKASSTTFYTVHYPFAEQAPTVVITRQGDELTIEGEGFVDSYNTSTRQYRRVAK